MEHSRTLLLEVWREACRHIRIDESAALIGRLVMARMSIDLLLVRRFTPNLSHIETVGVGQPDRIDHPAVLERHDLPLKRIRSLESWLASREVSILGPARQAEKILPLVIPAWVRTGALAAPLVSEHGTKGVLILQPLEGTRFSLAQLTLVRQLTEPIAAALENDHRLHELNALREVAEADRQSLLRRLGREGLESEIVGAAAGLKPVMERVELVSRADAPVLILGETGSGKEVIARAIHAQSARAGGPFIRVNCGAIPTELIDSELFGHEKGAFTGATASRRGWFERADEGTLFLDEIGELPLAAQVRLLRILQDGTFERVGSEQSLKVDVRMIAATHRDLPLMVQQSRFREDLWYRIAVFPIVLPPLREHKQDIPSLAAHFVRRSSRRFGVPEVQPSDEDMTMLARYDWPGNVREFAAVIDRAVILGEGARLEIARALGGSSVSSTIALTPLRTGVSDVAAGPTDSPRASLNEAIRLHIQAALTATRGRIEGPHGAARLLDINPHTLRAKMRKLGIDWSKHRFGAVE